ncbi:AsmA family protein [Gluconobacter sp. Dm-62]|uniref:AsmA family protein n=1 Tax=Gluconobacter sp. Dm-62 TaxID=2799804 RepID=UPI001B8A9B40|nr:AsmA family protein [Gluconobacter sp. Dm-62]MBS1102777.1 AsmA family protein [Gluconobacter sp. Dm-62]
MKKLTGALIAAIVALVGVSVATHFLIDQDALRERVAVALKHQTGLSMQVRHSSVQLLPWPAFEASDVVLTRDGQMPVLKAHTVHAGIAVFALLHREVRFQDFVIEGATVNLVRGLDGQANWSLTPDHEDENASLPVHGQSGQRIHAHWDLSLDGLHVAQAAVLWNDRLTRTSGSFGLDALDLAGLRSSSPWISLQGHHAGTPFTVKGHVGNLSQIRGTQPWAFSIGTTLGDGDKRDWLNLDGRIGNPSRMENVVLTAQGEWPNLQDVHRLFPHANLPFVPALGGDVAIEGSLGSLTDLDGNALLRQVLAGMKPTRVHLHAGYVALRQGTVRNLHIDSAGPDAALTLTADTQWRDTAWHVEAGAGTMQQALAAWQNGLRTAVPLTAELRSQTGLVSGAPAVNAEDNARFAISGTIGAENGHLVAEGNGKTLHLPGVVLHDVSLHGTLDAHDRENMLLDGLTFGSQELSLDGALKLVLGHDVPPVISGNLHAAKMDLDVLKGLWLPSASPAAPVAQPVVPGIAVPKPVAPQNDGPVPTAPNHLSVAATPADPTPSWVKRLRAQDVNLHLTADHVVFAGREYTDLVTRLTLSGGHLRLDPISGQAQGLPLSGMAELDASALPVTGSVTFQPLMLPAGLLETQLGMPLLLQGPVQVVGQLSAKGNSSDELRQSLDGHLGISMVDGQVQSELLGQMAGSAASVVLGKGGRLLRCLGLHMSIANDVAHIDTLGLQSGRFSTSGSGTVGLGTQALNLRLLPVVDFEGAGASTPVVLTGTLGAPHVAQDRDAGGNFHVTIGGDSNTVDPCTAPLAAAREGQAGPAPAAVKAHHSKAGDILRALGVLH